MFRGLVFLQSWAELIQLIVIVPAMWLAIWDLIVDLKDRDQDKLITRIPTEVMLREIKRRKREYDEGT